MIAAGDVRLDPVQLVQVADQLRRDGGGVDSAVRALSCVYSFGQYQLLGAGDPKRIDFARVPDLQNARFAEQRAAVDLSDVPGRILGISVRRVRCLSPAMAPLLKTMRARRRGFLLACAMGSLACGSDYHGISAGKAVPGAAWAFACGVAWPTLAVTFSGPLTGRARLR